MPVANVTIDITGFVKQVDEARDKDIPYATAVALTRTAQDGQTEMRRREGQIFTLRNAWTQQNTKITPAQKLSWPIQSEVYTDTANTSTGAPDYLERQEEGGEKVPVGGHAHLAIPTKFLRKYAPRVIPDELRPKNLLPAGAEIGKTYKGNFSMISGTRGRTMSKSARRAAGGLQYVAFIQVDRHGTLCVFVRTQSSGRDAEPWYILVPEAHVRAVLNMEQIVATVAEERFGTHWDDAWDSITG